MSIADLQTRSSGLLLHPSSLPGPYGIGDIGPAAAAWVDFVAATGCRMWQILPLGPTGYGDSPYQCFSSFAGNPYLVSPDLLLQDGLVSDEDLAAYPRLPAERVDYGAVIPAKLALLDRAFDRFGDAAPALRDEYRSFADAERRWLDDFAVFMTLKDLHGGAPWISWERPLRLHDPEAIADLRRRHADAVGRHVFRQWVFHRQWAILRQHAAAAGVAIIGDIPFFVAGDSADVWANRHLFQLDAEGNPSVIAGVPPDLFSDTGQRWGNPLYNWERHEADGYTWWVDRIAATLSQVDILRIDHFRAFVNYWEIPGGAPTAEVGRWMDGPGEAVFTAVRSALGTLPIIAEDLGELDPRVPALRDKLGLPGMKVLQFAFDGDLTHPFLPHNYPPTCVVYTGTHDNNTVKGWWNSAPPEERRFARDYLGVDENDPVEAFLEGVWSSVALLAIAPIQDALRLGAEGRMNSPGTTSGNWQWRLAADALTTPVRDHIHDLNRRYGR
jgi:4-alpha-glucanotransferase